MRRFRFSFAYFQMYLVLALLKVGCVNFTLNECLMMMMMITIGQLLVWLTEASRDDVTKVRWCQLDSGPTTISDRNGRRHTVHVSVWRDGSVWARVGRSAMDWTSVDERRKRIQTALLDDDAVLALQVLLYSDYCALSDIRLQLRVRAGWSPSYVVLIDAARARNRETRIVSVRNARNDCRFNATLTLSADTQRLACDAPTTSNSCGMRNVPSPRRTQSSAAGATLKCFPYEKSVRGGKDNHGIDVSLPLIKISRAT